MNLPRAAILAVLCTSCASCGSGGGSPSPSNTLARSLTGTWHIVALGGAPGTPFAGQRFTCPTSYGTQSCASDDRVTFQPGSAMTYQGDMSAQTIQTGTYATSASTVTIAGTAIAGSWQAAVAAPSLTLVNSDGLRILYLTSGP